MTRAQLESLYDRVRAELPAGVTLALADAADPQLPLFPEEDAAMARAVPSRRAEFTAGRAAARAALAALGGPGGAIPMQPDRAPLWPEGFCGSLTHTGSLCLAAVARLDVTRSLGIDLESDAPLEREILTTIASPGEYAAVSAPPERAARRIFSAKEAGYKAQYALSQTLFGFDGLIYEPHREGGASLRFARDTAPFAAGDRLPIDQWIHGGLILSLCHLPR